MIILARNIDNGKKALEELKKIGFEPRFHLLDLGSVDSIKAFAKYLKETHNGIDILVNNAAIFVHVNIS